MNAHVPGLIVSAVLLLAACTSPSDGGAIRGQGPGAPVSTPMLSLSADVAATASLLRGALSTIGRRLEVPATPYRPSEPASLAGVPRAVLRADTADVNQGFVVIYELPGPAEAADRARDMAAHLGSGFGQTNFPADAQFHVAYQGSTVIFTWWSRAGASDEAAAEGVFEALRLVGVEVPVVK